MTSACGVEETAALRDSQGELARTLRSLRAQGRAGTGAAPGARRSGGSDGRSGHGAQIKEDWCLPTASTGAARDREDPQIFRACLSHALL